MGTQLPNNDAFLLSILKLMETTNVHLILDQIAIGYKERAKASISERSPNANAIALAETLKVFDEEFDAQKQNLTTEIASLYKRAFEHEDVDGILDFYSSNVGQRFLNGSVQIEQSIQKTAQNWAQNASAVAFEQATKRIRESV